MKTRSSLLILIPVLACGRAGCSERKIAESGAHSAQASAPRPASSVALDLPGSIYAGSSGSQPLAHKLCETLHVVPGRRVAECCGSPPTRFLYDECVRVVSASLESQAVSLDAGSVERCRVAMVRALLGCDWVTPSQPLAPAECRGLLRGNLRAGSVCRSSIDCSGNLHCSGVSPTKSGICTVPQPNGAACGSHVDTLATYVLERDLEKSRPFCSEFCSLLTHKCEPAPPSGASCLSSANCGHGQSCSSGRCSDAPVVHHPSAKLGKQCAVSLDALHSARANSKMGISRR